MSDKPGLLALYHFSPWFTEELNKRFDVFGPFPTREIAPHMVPDDFKPRVRAIATVGSIGEGGRPMLDVLQTSRSSIATAPASSAWT